MDKNSKIVVVVVIACIIILVGLLFAIDGQIKQINNININTGNIITQNVVVGGITFSIPSHLSLNQSEVNEAHFNINGVDNREYVSINVYPSGFGEYEKYDKNTYTFPYELDSVPGGLMVYSMDSKYKEGLYGDVMVVRFLSNNEKFTMEISLKSTNAEDYKNVLESIKIMY
ncbi:hypothetical protein MBCUT_07230 [Methanobrevibacter cuticularis]|uniref:Uncharacterized protein n=1 Tax=Methanobrevibacter cuticularis TaxID=47311 RepID=A0A166EER3_9EURY|nr:hypothetical protein [Methanobrevibacter cuticularis]KZX16569.1 hypothetical protein MBCUT_07230 [Methanobrevibacter cuticularis]